MVSRYWASGSAQLVALVATIIVEQGQKEIMSRARIDETDVLAAARKHTGWSGWIKLSMRCGKRAAGYRSFPESFDDFSGLRIHSQESGLIDRIDDFDIVEHAVAGPAELGPDRRPGPCT